MIPIEEYEDMSDQEIFARYDKLEPKRKEQIRRTNQVDLYRDEKSPLISAEDMIAFTECKLKDIMDYNQDNPLYIVLFTWNPHDRRLMRSNTFTHEEKWDAMISVALRLIRECSELFSIMPEISDSNRLHCHGWIVVKDKIRWYKRVMPKFVKYGFIKCSKMNSVNALGYYKKDVEITAQVLPKHRLPFCCLNDMVYRRDRDFIHNYDHLPSDIEIYWKQKEYWKKVFGQQVEI